MIVITVNVDILFFCQIRSLQHKEDIIPNGFLSGILVLELVMSFITHE
ncbi:MAG: hypothetical protein WCL60_01875 [Methylococcales bacterium]